MLLPNESRYFISVKGNEINELVKECQAVCAKGSGSEGYQDAECLHIVLTLLWGEQKSLHHHSSLKKHVWPFIAKSVL